MGLLDQISGMLPDYLPDDTNKREAAKMGLLNFGAAMLANSRQGFAPALGGGLLAGSQTYQDAQAIQQRQALQKLQEKALNLTVQGQQMAFEKQKRIEDAYRGFYGQNPQGAAPQTTPIAAPTADNPAFPRQQYAPSWLPQQASAPVQEAAPAASAQPSVNDNYSRHLQFAQYLEGKGLAEEAQKYYDLAEKFKPKLKEQSFRRDANGNVVTVNVFEDGNTQVVPGYMPADKLSFHNLGNRTVGFDPYTGREVAAAKNGQSPDSVASNALGWANFGLSKQRFSSDLANQNKPQFVESLGGFVTLPTSKSPSGGFVPLNGIPQSAKASEDERKAAGWLSQANNAWNNMRSVMYGEDGKLKASVVKPGTIENSLSAIGLEEAANKMRDGDRQRFVQASSSMSEALLRAATGAGINAFEAKQKIDEITPRLTDKPEVIQQKLEAIPMYLESLQTRAGRALPAGSAPGKEVKAPQSKIVPLDGGGSATAIRGADGNYYVKRNGKTYRVEE